MEFPATYGEVMPPLDVTRLPDDLRSLYESDAVFREWTHLSDRVRRAEKISCWTQWTPQQSAAYKANDIRLFSQLRGYTDAEIAEFDRFMALGRELDARNGEAFRLDVEHLLGQLVETERLRAINHALFRMSEAALAHPIKVHKR